MKNKKIVWRLGQLPTPTELRELVADKIITKEEAREILFSSVEVEDTQQVVQSTGPPALGTGTITKYHIRY